MKILTTYRIPAIIAFSILLTSLLTMQAEGQGWYNGSWTYRKTITINSAKVGLGPHTNFPALFNSADTDLQARAQADGDDILFTSSDGVTKLDHEIESYSSGSGNLVAWIEVPTLPSSANTVIYMYYGNSTASSQQNVSGTWNTNFKGVWHLNNAFTDATTNANNGSNTGTTAVAGKMSGARGFVRSDGTDFVTINGLMGSPTSFSTSVWANLTTADISGSDIFSIGDYDMMRMDETSSSKTSGIFCTGPNAWTTTSSGTNYAGSGWHYVVYTCDDPGNSQKVFVDGIQVGSTSTVSSPIYTGAGTNTFIGKHGNGNTNFDFDGSIDEVRVANSVRSAGWILTEYNNQNSPSTFYTVGLQTTTKTFTGTGNFSDPTKWTGGTLPSAGENLIIDGACTVDNNAGTDNVAYGKLTIGTGTGRTLDWAAAGTNRLNVTDMAAGTGASTLNMTNGGTLIIRGVIVMSTSLTFLGGSGTLEIQSTMTLPALGTLNNFTINGAGSTVTLSAATTLTGNMAINAGTLNAGNFNLTIGNNWTNNVSTSAFIPGTSTVTFNSASAQAIGGTFATTFNHLVIANTGNIVTLNNNTNINGNLTVSSGTFNLASFTANRASSGGSLLVSNNATLKIGGTNTFPANYSSNVLVVASTVEYSGTNQTVASRTYGNLKLTSASGAAVKTLPVVALTVVGNLISAVGAGTSVSYTATTTVNVNGNVSIGASTTFNGGTSFHTIGGNWTNDGTFNPSTGTINFAGAGAAVGGSSTHNFYNLAVTGSLVNFSNVNIGVSSNLTTSGSGSFNHASGGTITMSGSGKVINGTGISLDNLVISGGITSLTSFIMTGNLIVNGSFSCTGTLTMSGTSKTITGTGSKTLSILAITGTITTANDFSISSALTVSGTFNASAGTSTFTGSSTLSGIANLYNVTINGTSLQLSANSNLGVGNTLNITSGTLNVTSATPNTVNFNSTGAQNINSIAYNNLTLSNGNNKTATAGLTINGSLTIGSGTTFIPGSFTHSIYKDWNNNGIFTAGSSTIQFLGNQNSNISGVTTFHILTVNNSSVTTSIILQNNITVNTVNMTMGKLVTQLNTITITSTRTGNGIIIGNIQRTHAFTTGVAYAFEGPDNTINFTAVSGVTSITVSVTQGGVLDFPYGACISRQYNILVPSGTYTATLRLHYENNELNGNDEAQMGMWNYDGTQWIPVGKSGNSSTTNYVEKSALTNMTNRWTCSFDPIVVLWNGSVSSDWNTAANWTVYVGSGATPPSANDIVVIGGIPFTYNPTISTAVQVKNVVFSNVPATLSMSSGGSLTSGDIQGVWMYDAVHTINVNNQTITVNGDLLLSDGVSNHSINLNIGNGTVNVAGTLMQAGNANLNFSAAGTLNISEDFNHLGGTFTAGAGSVVYNGSQNQAVGIVNYNNLSINNTGGNIAIEGALTVAGNLSIVDGELDNLATTTIIGDITISTGAVMHNSSVLHVGGNWNNNGSYIGEGTNVIFDGAGTQTISATTFNNLEFNKPVGSIAILTGDVIMNGNLVGTSGTLDIQSYFFNRLVVGGSATMANDATLIIAADNAPNQFASYNLAAGSKVIFNGTSTQHLLLPGVVYGHLTFQNSGLKILYTPITVNGDLTIASGASFDGGSNTITLNGNWLNSGTFTPSASTLLCAGTSKTITGNTTFNQATITGSYVILNNVTFNGLLTITSSGSLTGGGAINTTLHGDLINSGVLYTLGTTTFSGNVLQTLSLINAVTTVALTVNFNGSVSPVLNSTSAPQFGFLNINNTGGINPSVGWTILYSLVVGSGASFNGGPSVHNFLGTVTNNGSITSDGTLNFIPASTTTIHLGSNFTSTGTVIFGGAGATTLTGNPLYFKDVVINKSGSTLTAPATINISGNMLLNSGTFTAGTTIKIGGDWSMNGGTFIPGIYTVIFNGASAQLINGSDTSPTFNDVTVIKTPGTLLNTGGSVATLNLKNLTLTTGDFTAPATLNISGNLLLSSGIFSAVSANISGNWTNNGATFAPVSGSTVFNGTGSQTIGGTAILQPFYNLVVNKTAGTLLSVVGSTTSLIMQSLSVTAGDFTAPSALAVTGDVTLTSGTFTAGSYTTVSGNWTNNGGVFVPSSGTVMFSGSNPTAINGSTTTQTFHHITLNKTAGIFTGPATLNLGGNILLTSGTFVAGSAINLAGNWTNNGATFTPGEGTVTFNGTIGQVVNGSATTQIFNNIIINKTSGTSLITSGSTVTLTAQDFSETSGNFTAPATLNINGNIVLNAGTFTAGAITSLAGNMTNNGIFVPGTGMITFTGTGSNTLSGSSTTDFNNITLNKGTDYTSVLEVQSLITMPSGALTLTNGAFKISSASTITPFISDITTGNFLIPATSGLWNNGATIHSPNMNWTIAGLFEVSGGTSDVGSVADNVLIPKETSSIIMGGGNMNIASRISNPGVPWTLTITDGTMTCNMLGSTAPSIAPFNMDTTDCVFNMTGGTIIIQNAGGSVGENLGYHNQATGGTGFTGGTLQIGNASTSTAQTIGITSTNPINTLHVNSINAIAQLQTSPLTANGDVTISAGTLQANEQVLTVGNNWTNNSSATAFTAGTSEVIMTGIISGAVNGSFPTTFYNLTVQSSGNTVSLSNAVETYLENVLLINSGTIDTQDKLTLFSTAFTTASVGEISTGADLIGKITLQRFIPPVAGNPYGSWVAIGCPVQGATIANWNDDIITTGFAGSDFPPPYPFTNIQWYDESASGTADMGYQLVTSTTESILSDKGYFVYMQAPTQAMDVKGDIYKHTFNRELDYTNTGSAGDGWNLLVNQYPSEIDFRQMVVNGAGTASYYLFDSESNNYRFYNGLSQVGTAPRYISSSQSFFVQASAPGSFVKYDESYKTNNGTAFERDLPANSYAGFKISSANGSSDECILHFNDGATSDFEWNFDALKLQSMSPSATECALISTDNTKLSIDALPMETDSMNIPVYVDMPVPGAYTFEVITATNLPPGICLFVEDLLSGNTMPIEAGQLWTINVTEAYTGNRFVIHASPSLNITTTNVSCYGSSNGVAEVSVPDGNWNITLYDEDGSVVSIGTNNVTFEDLTAGDYELQATNSLFVCPTSSISFSISEPLQISAELLSSTVDHCNSSEDGTIEWTVNNMNTEYTYSVQNSEGMPIVSGVAIDPMVHLENLTGDIYTVNIENGCGTLSIIENIKDPNAVTSEIMSEDINLSIIGETNPSVIIGQACLNANTYTWLLNGEISGIDDSWTHTFDGVGEFTLTLNAQNEFCFSSDSMSIHVDESLTVDEYDANQFISTLLKMGELIVTFNESISENLNLSLYDMNGNVLWNNSIRPVKGGQISINLSQYAKGVYVVRAIAGGQQVMHKKFVSQ